MLAKVIALQTSRRHSSPTHSALADERGVDALLSVSLQATWAKRVAKQKVAAAWDAWTPPPDALCKGWFNRGKSKMAPT